MRSTTPVNHKANPPVQLVGYALPLPLLADPAFLSNGHAVANSLSSATSCFRQKRGFFIPLAGRRTTVVSLSEAA
jgi:hypothetical protein